MVPNRTWQQFTKAPENAKLSLQEAKRKYNDERKRWQQEQDFINSGLYMKG